MTRAHRRFSIPRRWSPEQAEAVWELLTDLAEAIWDRYETPLIERDQPWLHNPYDRDAEQLDLWDHDYPSSP